MSKINKSKKNVTSKDSVDNEETTQNPSLENNDLDCSYNPDDREKYLDMIKDVVEMKLIFYCKVHETFDGENDELLYYLQEEIDYRCEIYEQIFQTYWKTQENESDEWCNLSLTEKVAQFSEEQLNWYINILVQQVF